MEAEQGADPGSEKSRLGEAIERVAHVLPAQGPLSIFIHHNTLHAFESAEFDVAVAAAAAKFSCEPYLSEEEYRVGFLRGRITDHDLDEALGDEESGGGLAAPRTTRRELRRRIAKYGIPEAAGPALRWLIHDSDAVVRFRRDLPSDAVECLLSPIGADGEGSEREAALAAELWSACLDAAGRSSLPAKRLPDGPAIRHRDLLFGATGHDIDEWVHPLLIRAVAAFMDQGLARQPLPGRERGFLLGFLELYARPAASLIAGWTSALPALLEDERRSRPAALDSLAESLRRLGVDEDEAPAFLEAEALALKGWAGMTRQFETRPDRIPAHPVPASLAEFLAVRLLLTRVAAARAARDLPGFDGELSRLRSWLRERRPKPRPYSAYERAWPLFHAAQLCGLSPEEIAALTPDGVAALEREIETFDSLERRRVLHSAFERHLRARLCDALASHSPHASERQPRFQAIFCLDEREESIRRHLEEADPAIETFGAAGFFSAAIYYQGATDARPRPLCPISIKPEHYIDETKLDPSSATVRLRRFRRQGWGRLAQAVQLGSPTALGGALIAALLGPLSALPLVFRVIFPGLTRRWRLGVLRVAEPRTRLRLDRRPGRPPVGAHWGFTKEEMADIVESVLRGIGVEGRLAPLVAVLGHGSSSLNNPQESAHDCGACGGGRGGPNARAFAQMANDPAVRALLENRGLSIPDETWFIGGQRNTCDNAVDFYDLDLLPEQTRLAFDSLAKAFARARRKEAHERCRRFDSFPLEGGTGAALAHVVARSRDLAQPRPEFGHASNAFCVIGRRSRTRGLFLDRRSFLTSYDPTRDTDGTALERTLAAVIPVVAGISLEYYFSRVDPTGYGCGTKLPHNVACLLGVMDGAQSDLRPGLPWQMVEIHEPVRLFVVIEAAPEAIERALARLPQIRGLFDRRWLFAASLDPESSRIKLREGGAYRDWRVERPVPRAPGDSASWYSGKRGHLPFARLVGREAAGSPS